MYERDILVVGFPPAGVSPWLLRSPQDIKDDMEVDGYLDDIPLINDLEGYPLASGSDASLSSEVQVADYEATVIDRLDCIAVSSILSTCFLFLLFLRSRR